MAQKKKKPNPSQKAPAPKKKPAVAKAPAPKKKPVVTKAPAPAKNFKQAGPVLSQREVKSIAQAKGITPTRVISNAIDKGVGVGSKVVKNYNTPGGLGTYRYDGTPTNLNPLKGLSIPKGTAYFGASTTSTPSTRNVNSGYSPGSVTYNPIVLPRSGVPQARTAAPEPAAAAPTEGGPVDNWENSVNNSNQELIDSINAQIEANATQAELYMGQIDSLMQAMQEQAMNPNGGLQSFTPYAVTTSVAPAAGAQTTQAITARKKPAVTDLTLNPLVMADAGTGLNIGI